MGTNVNWANPYADRTGRWFKGNIHTHVAEGSGCAKMKFAEAVDAYLADGFDFISVSDHFVLTELSDRRIAQILGMEWTGLDGRHTGIYAMDPEMIQEVRRTAEQRDALEYLSDKVALTVINHPRWIRKGILQYDWPALDALGPYDAMEIYNLGAEMLAGIAETTECWDYVLSGGRRVLGVAGDDAHRTERIGRVFNMVRAAEATGACIFDAMRAGNFYASTGVVLTDIRRQGDTITVESADAQEIRAIGSQGRVLAMTEADRLTVDLSDINVDDPMYVRFEAFGRGSRKAWTQPLFLA